MHARWQTPMQVLATASVFKATKASSGGVGSGDANVPSPVVNTTLVTVPSRSSSVGGSTSIRYCVLGLNGSTGTSSTPASNVVMAVGTRP